MNDLSNSKWLIITAIVSGEPGKKEMNYFLGKYVTMLIHSFTMRDHRIIIHGCYQHSPFRKSIQLQLICFDIHSSISAALSNPVNDGFFC